MTKILIQKAFIVEGSKKKPFLGDVYIENGRIVQVFRKSPVNLIVDRKINAAGKFLAPGFIDVHTHSDISIFSAPTALHQLAQGVTTEVIGNCGLSPYPVTNYNRDHLNELYQRYGVSLTWTNFTGYAEQINRLLPGINLVSLIGHNTLRAAVLGYDNKKASLSHITQMKQLLQQLLNEGAAGLSLGLLYVPGKFTETDEIIQCLEPLSKSLKVLTAHLRSEGDQLLESIEEMFLFARSANLSRIHLSHLKTAQHQNWYKIDQLIELLSHPNIPEISQLTADRYPYTESMTSLSIIVPPPFDKLDDSSIMKALQNSENFQKVVSFLKEKPSVFWETTRLLNSQREKDQPWFGKSIAEIATQWKCDAAVLCTEIIRDNATTAMASFAGMSKENLQQILQIPFVCCGSDENTKPLDYSLGRSHPRLSGSIPKFFQMVRQYTSIEDAVYRLTALPASIFKIQKRGLIHAGYYADLVLFDPDQFVDQSTFESPHALAKGISTVFIHGQLAYHEGELSHNRFGQLLHI